MLVWMHSTMKEGGAGKTHMLQAKVEFVVREDERRDEACSQNGTILAAHKHKPLRRQTQSKSQATSYGLS